MIERYSQTYSLSLFHVTVACGGNQSFQMARLCARCPCHVDAELCKADLGDAPTPSAIKKKEKHYKCTGKAVNDTGHEWT